MTYTIRPVRPTDLAAVTEVEAICFPAAEAAAEESFKARIAAFPECFFVAEADGKIIGFINAAPQIPKRFMTRCTKIPPATGRTAHTSLFSDWM